MQRDRDKVNERQFTRGFSFQKIMSALWISGACFKVAPPKTAH